MRRMVQLGSVVVSIAWLMASSDPARALPLTFAQFQEAGRSEPFSFKSTAATGSLSTLGNSTAVSFSFKPNAILGVLAPALTGNLAARLSLTATASSAAPFDDGAYAMGGQRGTSQTDDQPFDSLRMAFTLDRPYQGHSNLLTLSVTPENVGSVNESNPTLVGSQGAHSATIDGGTLDLGVAFSSDFLDFSVTVQRDFALSFTAVNPVGISFDQRTQTFLSNFVADATGTFDSDPPPTTMQFGAFIPEPASISVFAMGLLGMVGFGRPRRRRSGS